MVHSPQEREIWFSTTPVTSPDTIVLRVWRKPEAVRRVLSQGIFRDEAKLSRDDRHQGG